MRSAIQALSTRDDVDPQHFGLWGADLGGYAALEVATSDPRIAAFAVDDAYEDPRDMVQIEVKRSGLAVLPFVTRFCDFGFRMLNYSYRDEPPVSRRLIQTKGIPKMFIQSSDRVALADDVMTLYQKAPDPKQIVRNRLSYAAMSDDDRKTYESTIVNFFLLNLTPSAKH